MFNESKKDSLEVDIKFIEKKILTFLKNFKISNLNNCILIDKSLENFFYIDVIKLIFPHAKFIKCEREIGLVLFSILKNNLFQRKNLVLSVRGIHDVKNTGDRIIALQGTRMTRGSKTSTTKRWSSLLLCGALLIFSPTTSWLL